MTDDPKNQIAEAIIGASDSDLQSVDDRNLADQPCNDFGNGQRLIARFGHNIRHTAAAGWYVWDGRRWNRSVGQRGVPGAGIIKCAQAVSAAMHKEADALELDLPPDTPQNKDQRSAILRRVRKLREHAVRSGNHGMMVAMLHQAEPDAGIAPEVFDAKPNLFNVANGTIDLDADIIQPRSFRREDHLTHISPVVFDAEAGAPRWRAFLRQVLPDQETRNFLQRLLGYCLTGRTDEQRLIIAYGTGANGKSVLFNTISKVLGSYSMTAAIQTFLHGNRRSAGDATPDLARLAGIRFVTAAEPEIGAKLNESLIKVATGGDRISARHLFEGTFEFMPCFKLVLLANVRPSVRGQDEGIWRRILLIPFDVTIPESDRDPKLFQWLVDHEAPGILNWLLDGWREYRERGLDVPESVLAATAEYRSASDSVYEFMRTCTETAKGERLRCGKLYESYKAWCLAGTSEPCNITRFGLKLRDLGYTKDRVGGCVYYLNIATIEDNVPIAPDSSNATQPPSKQGKE